MIKKISSLVFLFFLVHLSAQNNTNHLKSVGFGEGMNFETAKNEALRNSLEMVIGTFIKTSTEIENNKVLTDQVLSMSSGVIQSYKIISKLENNESWQVVVESMISVNNTVKYIESISPSGSEVEIKGGVFAINQKLKEFARENEWKIINDVAGELHNIFQKSFDYILLSKEPQNFNNNYKIENIISVYANQNINQAANLIVETLESISLSSEELKNYQEENHKYYTLTLKHVNILHVFHLREVKSIELIGLIFKNFDYYITLFELSDGINAYKSHQFTFQRREKKKFISYAETSGFDNYKSMMFASEELFIIPKEIYYKIKNELKPNEWTGARRLSKKAISEISDDYKFYPIVHKDESLFKIFLNRINSNPNDFDQIQQTVKHKFTAAQLNLLKGFKGTILSKEYLINTKISGIVYNINIPSLNEQICTLIKKNDYSLTQLETLKSILVIPLGVVLPFKHGGIYFEDKDKKVKVFSLFRDYNNYNNLNSSNFVKNSWIVPEKKDFEVIKEFTDEFPYFNLFPTEVKNTFTSRILGINYNHYLSRNLVESYENWDGTKEYGEPYIYGSSNSGELNKNYKVTWIKKH